MMELVTSSAMASPAAATPTPSAMASNNAANDAAVAAGSPVLSALAQQGGARGGLGGLLGGLMNAAQAPAGGGNPALAQQAGARKAHVTGLFVAKGCKLSDVQR